MERKKMDVLFGVIVLVGFLAISLILIKDFNARRANDIKEYSATVTNIVRMKNNKIRVLYNRLLAQHKENEDLKNTLSETRNALEGLTRKLAQPAVVNAPTPATVAK